MIEVHIDCATFSLIIFSTLDGELRIICVTFICFFFDHYLYLAGELHRSAYYCVTFMFLFFGHFLYFRR